MTACFLLTFSVHILSAQTEVESQQKAAELETVRTKIKSVESNIQAARTESDQLYIELQSNEKAAASVSNKLNSIESDISDKLTLLTEANLKKKNNLETLRKEQSYLSQQIRAAYKIGQNDYLKLLLNQEDLARVGRMLVYYDYFNQARASRIEAVNITLEKISHLEKQIRSEKEQLDILRADQLTKLEEFALYRISRKGITDKLANYIDEQDSQLRVLQSNEQQLEELLSRLEENESIVQTFEDIPPFESLLGKLKWPVGGKITTRFGTLRKGGKLRWQGVTIAAESGNNVQAISPGKVVFADWFRNMGLLIIIDHGNGYMSLYGHNERLSKKVGDWVAEGENIAKVGDTGGQQKPNLYFEIRYSGDPVNPGKWCKS